MYLEIVRKMFAGAQQNVSTWLGFGGGPLVNAVTCVARGENIAALIYHTEHHRKTVSLHYMHSDTQIINCETGAKQMLFDV